MLILYTKGDCPLCDELKDELARLSVVYVERDMVTNADWYRRYHERIPVLVDASGKEHDPPFTAARLERILGLLG